MRKIYSLLKEMTRRLRYLKCCKARTGMFLNVPKNVRNMLVVLYCIAIFGNSGNPKLEIKAMEQQIISSYNHQELRELLTKMSSKNLSRSIWKINPRWELPIPLQSVLNSLSRGKTVFKAEIILLLSFLDVDRQLTVAG